jgi:hypothetical protein
MMVRDKLKMIVATKALILVASGIEVKTQRSKNLA